MNSLLIFLIIIGVFYFLIKKNKPIVKQPTIRFSRMLHYAFIIGYVVFLLAILVTSEFVEQQQPPLPVVSELAEPDFLGIDNALIGGEISEVADSSQFLEKNIHPAGKTLKIYNPNYEANIFVKRKKNNDGIIEEFIFKPMFSVNDQNFSHKVNVSKPIWKNDTMMIPEQPVTEIRNVEFHDSALLGQMTKVNFHSSSSSSSISGLLIIYLLIPDDVEIDTVSENYIQYIE